MLQRIDMVAMYVHEWPAAVAWYEAKLGLSTAYKEDDHEFAVLGFPGGGPVRHLVGDQDRQQGTRNRCVPNLAVDDFDTTLAELTSRDVEILEIINDTDDGYRLARLADPEGNEL